MNFTIEMFDHACELTNKNIIPYTEGFCIFVRLS